MAYIPPPDYPVESKECKRCFKVKDLRDFHRLVKSKDGRGPFCKKCANERTLAYLDKRKPKLPVLREQETDVQRLAMAWVDNPKATVAIISEVTGFSPNKINYLTLGNQYLRAMKAIAKNKFSLFVPKALKAMDESLESINADVKLKSAVKVLENEDVIGPTKVDVGLDIRSRPTSELVEILARAKAVEGQTIQDAELIS